ncbi:unnamed protein product [Penicillium viridicatum]
MTESDVGNGAPAPYTKSAGLPSQSLRIWSNTVATSEIYPPKATTILQWTMLGSNPIAQSWTSPLQTRSSETGTDTFTLTWSEPRTTTGETTNGITGYFKVDDELGRGGLVPRLILIMIPQEPLNLSFMFPQAKPLRIRRLELLQ